MPRDPDFFFKSSRHQMAEEACPERRTTLQFTIPTAPSPPIAGPDAARPSLGQHFNATTNANAACTGSTSPCQRQASAPLALLTPRRAGRSCLHRLRHQLQQQQNPLQSLRTTTGKLQQEQQQQQQSTRNKCRRTTRSSTGARHLGEAHSVAYQSGP